MLMLWFKECDSSTLQELIEKEAVTSLKGMAGEVPFILHVPFLPRQIQTSSPRADWSAALSPTDPSVPDGMLSFRKAGESKVGC